MNQLKAEANQRQYYRDELPQIRNEEKLVHSLIKALQLKTLPKHLKYIFLGENDTLSIIINADLSIIQEQQLKSMI